MSLAIRPVQAADFEQWAALFRAYRDFYRLAPDEAVVERVWSWLLDSEHESNGLVAEDTTLVGLAHYRRFARPSTGSVGIYLDDLFTDPHRRGGGVGRALIEKISAIGADEGCSVVRWITASDNVAGQRLYDSLAVKTSWLTYDKICQ